MTTNDIITTNSIMTTDELIDAVKRWGAEKGLNDPKAQLNKVIEEVGEMAHEISRNQYGRELEDAIGDTLVTVIILSAICGFDPMYCLGIAYNEIKGRKGHTQDGSFIKDTKPQLNDERVGFQSY